MSAADEVSRLAPPLPRMTFECPACGGLGVREDGFAFGGNIGRTQQCRQCGGSGLVWADVEPGERV